MLITQQLSSRRGRKFHNFNVDFEIEIRSDVDFCNCLYFCFYENTETLLSSILVIFSRNSEERYLLAFSIKEKVNSFYLCLFCKMTNLVLGEVLVAQLVVEWSLLTPEVCGLYQQILCVYVLVLK